MSAVEMMQNLFLRSGASWVLWALIALSVAVVVVAVERWLYYRTIDVDLRRVAEELDGRLDKGEFKEAIEELRRSKSVAANVAAAGLRLAPRGPEAVGKAMESAMALEKGRLEKRLAFLGTVGSNAPFVGLFGTVIGIIHAFEELGHAAPGHATGGGAAQAGASAASQVASQAVMSSIAEALVATAVGIVVALPAIALYNYLQRRVATLLDGSAVLSNLVLAYLSTSHQGAPAAGPPPGPSNPPRAEVG